MQPGPAIGAVRLYGGVLPDSGLLQVCNRDISRSSAAANNPPVWGAVCGTGFKGPEARAVCRCAACGVPPGRRAWVCTMMRFAPEVLERGVRGCGFCGTPHARDAAALFSSLLASGILSRNASLCSLTPTLTQAVVSRTARRHRRQLGYTDGVVVNKPYLPSFRTTGLYYTFAPYPPGTPVWLDNVHCRANATRITDCSSNAGTTCTRNQEIGAKII